MYYCNYFYLISNRIFYSAENVWGMLMLDWEARHERTKAALSAHAHASWELFRLPRGTQWVQVLQETVRSMPRRLAAVIAAGGRWTKY